MHENSTALVHLCGESDWHQAQVDGAVCPPSLEQAGFVHLSTPQQVHLPANRLYGGRTDLVLLVCDPAALGSPIRWEPGVPGDPESMVFPHLYGPLPTAAVRRVERYQPGPDGVFAELGTGVSMGD